MKGKSNNTEQLRKTINVNFTHNMNYLFLDDTVSEVELQTKELRYKLVKKKDCEIITIYPINNSGHFIVSKYRISYINNGNVYCLYDDKSVRYIKKRAFYNKNKFFANYIDHTEDVVVKDSLKNLDYVKRDVDFIVEFYLLLLSNRQAIMEKLNLTYKRED